MRFSGQQAQPSVAALWSREPLDTFTLAGISGVARFVDTTGYNALQLFVQLVPLGAALGPYAQIDIDWTNGINDRYEVGFPDNLKTEASFRIPVMGPEALITLTTINSPGADTGTVTCAVFGTNAPAYGCAPGLSSVIYGGVLVDVTGNVNVGAQSFTNMPFYYGRAIFHSQVGEAGASVALEYEQPLGSNTWRQFARIFPGGAVLLQGEVMMPAKHCRVARNGGFALGFVTAVVIASPTIGISS